MQPLSVLSAVTFCLGVVANCSLARSSSVEPPLTVAAFNVQNLGQHKLGNPFVMGIVTKVIIRYDLILIQEIVTKDKESLDDMLNNINREASLSGVEYAMELSPRLGSTYAKEQYAYIYRKEKLQVVESEEYPDENELFERPPLMTLFASPSTRDLPYFVCIGVHTQPRQAAEEIDALAKVYDFAKNFFQVEDVILMGDMNAGCGHVRVHDWPDLELVSRPEFHWLIDHSVDTTKGFSCCPYDRFVVVGDKMKRAVIEGQVKTFDYLKQYNLSHEQGEHVSDHLVIEMKIRGKLSEEAEKLKTKICFSVQDQTWPNFIPTDDDLKMLEFKSLSDEAGTPREWLFTLETSKMADILNHLRVFQNRGIIYPEVLDTVVYKRAYGALADPSTFAARFQAKFNLDVKCRVAGACQVLVCRDTIIY